MKGRFRLSFNLHLGRSPGHRPRARRTIALLLAIVLPLGLVGGLWATGILRFPRLEALTGFAPGGDGSVGPAALSVDEPANEELIDGPVLFSGHASPGGAVYIWERDRNVPVIARASTSGDWTYLFTPAALSQGAHRLQFASTNGASWSAIVERTVDVAHPVPEAADSGEAPGGWRETIPQPLLVVGQAIGGLLGGVSVSVTETVRHALENDLNQDGVPDWVQGSIVAPTDVPPRLVPVINSPTWLNLLLLTGFLATPATLLILRRPDGVLAFLRARSLDRAMERTKRREFILAQRKLRSAEDLEREALRVGGKASAERLKARAQLKERANRLRLEAYRLGLEARKHITQTRARAETSLAGARLETEKVRAQTLRDLKEREVTAARLDLERARATAEKAPRTVINVGRLPRHGAFRARKRRRT